MLCAIHGLLQAGLLPTTEGNSNAVRGKAILPAAPWVGSRLTQPSSSLDRAYRHDNH